MTADVEGGEYDAELALLGHIRASRSKFLSDVTSESGSREPDVISLLRSENTYILAEFLFQLRARRIDSSEKLEALVGAHNEFMARLAKDPILADRLGLNRDHILDAIITGEVLPRLRTYWSEYGAAIDQSTLARFLITLMSAETCRKVIVASEKAGFLDRVKKPGGTILVVSHGRLEEMFGDHLTSLLSAIKMEQCDAS
jgi:hypothetical protein